ncbi:MAG: oligoendopeptidase F [Chloroflexota bacterium]
MKKSTALPKRSDIPQKYTWDLESVFPDVAAWEQAIESVYDLLASASTFRGRLHESAEVLVTFLAEQDEIYKLLMKIYTFGSLPASVNTGDLQALAQRSQVMGLMGSVSGAIAFAPPEIVDIGFDVLDAWQRSSAELARYSHYFERLKMYAPHMLSAEVEEVLGLASDVFSTMNQTHSILANGELPFQAAIDSNGDGHPVAQSTIRKLMASEDQTLRQSAYNSYTDAHIAFKNTMANAMSAGIKKNVLDSKLRGYSNALESAMKSSYIPVEVFHNLIETYKENLPTWHKYWDVRRKALGLETLSAFDVQASLSKNPPVVSYEQAIDWIASGMSPLGKDYVNVLRKGALEDRWVDVYPNEGKRMGAFSAGSGGTKPFIMLSYTDDLFGLSTLAHEFGHSMHSYYTWQTQNIVPYTRYGLFVAEVASNFNQAMVRAYLLDLLTDPEHQIAIIEEAMANFYRYFFIMPTLARFELSMHERIESGRALTSDFLIETMANYLKDGFGDKVAVDHDRIGITWATFHTHLYSNFYVYKYATGISAAHMLAESILNNESGAVDRYLSMLKAGGSMFPLDVLKMAGVDMTTPEPVEKTFEVLARHVDRLDSLVSNR